jgi:hypothetical protein
MDPTTNPFAPGAGSAPPALTGRDEIIRLAEIALQRIKDGRSEKSQFLLGLRGVGKTVLLNHIGHRAEELGYHIVPLEAPEGKRLAELLAPALKSVLLKLSRVEKAKQFAMSGLAALRGFASVFKVSIGEIGLEITDAPAADSGNLEIDLPELFEAVGKAARAAGSSVAILVDEVQYLNEEDFRALIVAMHRVSQRSLPIVLFGAGLPQAAGLAGEAKSYAERLFDFPEVGPLDADAARQAIVRPIEAAGASIAGAAVDRIVQVTRGYAYFLQEWGKHAWNAAAGAVISEADAEAASEAAKKALDKSFFKVRFDRLTPAEQGYLRAMASLGSGPHRSGDIAKALGRDSQSLGPTRSSLIRKGMVWSPSHGETAFTVPLFDEFMTRVMPDWVPAGVPPSADP